MLKRIRDYQIEIGELPTGRNNQITDVEGVKVGHVTVSNQNVQTGVTAILPHSGIHYKEKVLATSHVINGFGKTIGTIQVEELGQIETPILLTNTLSVGTAAEALVEYSLKENPEIGVTTGTVNPVVGECNDGYLNNIRGLHITKEHCFEAISNASIETEEGAVGAGRGMSAFGLKGGIGTSSRVIAIDKKTFTVGVLVLANFGQQKDFMMDGQKMGQQLISMNSDHNEPDKGSIMIILATNLPCSERQLKRICKRTSVGLARVGSYIGHGSGDIVLGFSTANRIFHDEQRSLVSWDVLNENKIDLPFRAAVEATEEAILNALITSQSVKGRDNNQRIGLQDLIGKLRQT